MARYGGHDILAELRPGRGYDDREIIYSLADAPSIATTVTWRTSRPAPPRSRDAARTRPVDLGTSARLDNLPGRISKRLEHIAIRQSEVDRNVHNARALQGQPFKHADALAAARERYQALSDEIAATGTAPTYEIVRPRHQRTPSPPGGGTSSLDRSGVTITGAGSRGVRAWGLASGDSSIRAF